MVIYTLKKANKRDRERLIEILDKKEKTKKEILEAISILQKCNSIEYAKKKAEEIVRKSWEKIDKILIEGKAKRLLKELVQFLVERRL
jgi:geranylgeranyl diphosphate synthase type I